MTNWDIRYIILKLSERDRHKNAAIAQQVERILGKDEVASSNLASSSKPLKLLEFQGFFLFLSKSYDLILHIKILIRDEVIIMKKIEMPTRESKNFLEPKLCKNYPCKTFVSKMFNLTENNHNFQTILLTFLTAVYVKYPYRFSAPLRFELLWNLCFFPENDLYTHEKDVIIGLYRIILSRI